MKKINKNTFIPVILLTAFSFAYGLPGDLPNQSNSKILFINNSGEELLNFRIRSGSNQWEELGKVLPGENEFNINKRLNENSVGTFEFQTVSQVNKNDYMLGGYNYYPDHLIKIIVDKKSFNLNVPKLDKNGDLEKLELTNLQLIPIPGSSKDKNSYMGCQGVGVIYGHVWCQGEVDYNNWGWGLYIFPYAAGAFSSNYSNDFLVGLGSTVTANGLGEYGVLGIGFTTDAISDVGDYTGGPTSWIGGFSARGGSFSYPSANLIKPN